MSKAEKKERNSASGPREQIPPIYKVVTGGVTVEFTDKIQDANFVFRDAFAKPKFIYSVFGKDVKCIAAAY